MEEPKKEEMIEEMAAETAEGADQEMVEEGVHNYSRAGKDAMPNSADAPGLA